MNENRSKHYTKLHAIMAHAAVSNLSLSWRSRLQSDQGACAASLFTYLPKQFDMQEGM